MRHNGITCRYDKLKWNDNNRSNVKRVQFF